MDKNIMKALFTFSNQRGTYYVCYYLYCSLNFAPCNDFFFDIVSRSWPQLASLTEIPTEAKATPVFLLRTSSSSTCTLIQDSVPKLKIDFLNNNSIDFDKIWKL